MNEKILIIDYGSQYTQLIARNIREQNVYCVVHPYNKLDPIISNYSNLIGIILSGGPNSVKEKKSPKLNKKGVFNCKIKKGKEEKELISVLKSKFDKVSYFKPESSRKDSSEIFIVAINFLI